MKRLILLAATALIATGCAIGAPADNAAIAPQTVPTKAVVVMPKPPTATNFPRIGTPTPVPPTPTPAATPTPAVTRVAAFDDATLEKLMAGTISSAGIDSVVKIVDNRANGGERTAIITIVSEYSLEDNDLLLKLFVLEVGNALRTIRAFSEGNMQADLDSAKIIVNDKNGNQLGTVTAPMPEIVRFLDGETSTTEALSHLSATGVFKSFIENY